MSVAPIARSGARRESARHGGSAPIADGGGATTGRDVIESLSAATRK